MRQLPCIRPGSQAGRESPRIKLASRVDGQHEVCSLFGNAWFTSYHTRPGGMRQDVLAVIWGQEVCYRPHDEALAWLQASSLSQTLQRRVRGAVPWHRQDRSRAPAPPDHGGGHAQSPAAVTGG